MIDKENFCIQPWIHLATWNDGSVPLCCIANPEYDLNLNKVTPKEAWNSEQFKLARLKFLAGDKLKQCSSCWKEEESGIKSHRIIENHIWQQKLGKEFLENLISKTNSDGSVDHYPITSDLRLGNTCNLQCVMCRPRDSSKWLNDAKKLANILVVPDAKHDWEYKANSIQSTDCFDWFTLLETRDSLNDFMKDIRHIIFGGGEPLLIKEHLIFLKSLVENDYAKNIEIRYHTNGTILNEELIEIWSNFKEVELMISIDDWGERNNYVRYPSNWDVIILNLDRLDDTPDNIVVSILTTVHAMNIYNLPDFAMQIIDKKWKKIGSRHDGLFAVGSTHWPKYMAVSILPQHIKTEISTYWDSFETLNNKNRWTSRIKSQLNLMNSSDGSNLFSSFIDYVEKTDSIRPIKFSHLYSDYYQLLKRI
jgi:hypothetical protein